MAAGLINRVVPSTAFALGVIRAIVSGAFLVSVLITSFSALGTLPVTILRPTGIMKVFPWGFYDRLLAPSGMNVLKAALIVSLLLSAAGLLTFVSTKTSFLLVLFYEGLVRSFGHFNHDEMLGVYCLAVLAFTPCGDAFSLDRLIRKRDPESSRLPFAYSYPILLMQALMAWTYFSSAFIKMRVAGWKYLSADNLPALAIFHSLDNLHDTHFRLAFWLPQVKNYLPVAVALVLLWELSFPLAIFLRRLRWWILGAGVLFHLSTLFFMNIFFPHQLALYLIFVNWDRVKENTGMPKSFRVSVVIAGLIVGLLGLSQVVFAGGMVPQSREPAANSSDTAKAPPSQIKSSRKKKKKTTNATSFVILGTYATPQVSEPVATPIATTSVEVAPAPAAPAPSSRSTIRATRTTGIQALPVEGPAQAITATAGQLIISEFRVRGPNGAADEFIEIFNASGADHTVAASSGSGYGVAASDGVVRCTIPNGTVIPNRGHYLCVNSVGYSIASYAAGNGTTATGDATYTLDIPDNAGIALFTTNNPGSFSLATRLDAVGSTAEANTLYKEGTGYPALVPFSIDYSFYRDTCGKGGSITTFGACPTGGLPKDTNNNAADFVFVDTNATSAGAGQRLGVPGPENLSSPIERNASFAVNLLDTCVAATSPTNRLRDFTSDPANNSAFGTLDIRRTIVNNTGGNVTRLRFRIVDITTYPAPGGIADLRPRTSTSVVVTVDRPPCGSGTSNVTVNGTTLEVWDPPGPGTSSQPNGGGFNSSMSAGTITLATPLANGASVDVRLLLGIQQTGSYKFFFNVEALP